MPNENLLEDLAEKWDPQLGEPRNSIHIRNDKINNDRY